MFVLYFLVIILYNEGNAFIRRDYGQICITFGF